MVFFRDLPIGTEVVVDGVLAKKIAPKKAITESGKILSIADSVRVKKA